MDRAEVVMADIVVIIYPSLVVARLLVRRWYVSRDEVGGAGEAGRYPKKKKKNRKKNTRGWREGTREIFSREIRNPEL